MSQSSYVHLEDCEIITVTDKAILIVYNEESNWFPRSQIADEGDDLKKGDKGVTVSVTEWIAKEKGIEIED